MCKNLRALKKIQILVRDFGFIFNLALLVHNPKRNAIDILKKEKKKKDDGSWVLTTKEIVGYFVNFFNNLFKSSNLITSKEVQSLN